MRRVTPAYELEGAFARAQPFPTGRQDAQARTARQQRCGQLGAGIKQVLTVVQDEQQLPIPQGVRQLFEQRAVGRFAHRGCHRYGLWNKHGVGQCGYLRVHHAVAVRISRTACQLDGEARLADPAGAYQ